MGCSIGRHDVILDSHSGEHQWGDKHCAGEKGHASDDPPPTMATALITPMLKETVTGSSSSEHPHVDIKIGVSVSAETLYVCSRTRVLLLIAVKCREIALIAL